MGTPKFLACLLNCGFPCPPSEMASVADIEIQVTAQVLVLVLGKTQCPAGGSLMSCEHQQLLALLGPLQLLKGGHTLLRVVLLSH
jgi:hypothetical protein